MPATFEQMTRETALQQIGPLSGFALDFDPPVTAMVYRSPGGWPVFASLQEDGILLIETARGEHWKECRVRLTPAEQAYSLERLFESHLYPAATALDTALR